MSQNQDVQVDVSEPHVQNDKSDIESSFSAELQDLKLLIELRPSDTSALFLPPLSIDSDPDNDSNKPTAEFYALLPPEEVVGLPDESEKTLPTETQRQVIAHLALATEGYLNNEILSGRINNEHLEKLLSLRKGDGRVLAAELATQKSAELNSIVLNGTISQINSYIAARPNIQNIDEMLLSRKLDMKSLTDLDSLCASGKRETIAAVNETIKHLSEFRVPISGALIKNLVESVEPKNLRRVVEVIFDLQTHVNSGYITQAQAAEIAKTSKITSDPIIRILVRQADIGLSETMLRRTIDAAVSGNLNAFHLDACRLALVEGALDESGLQRVLDTPVEQRDAVIADLKIRLPETPRPFPAEGAFNFARPPIDGPCAKPTREFLNTMARGDYVTAIELANNIGRSEIKTDTIVISPTAMFRPERVAETQDEMLRIGKQGWIREEDRTKVSSIVHVPEIVVSVGDDEVIKLSDPSIVLKRNSLSAHRKATSAEFELISGLQNSKAGKALLATQAFIIFEEQLHTHQAHSAISSLISEFEKSEEYTDLRHKNPRTKEALIEADIAATVYDAGLSLESLQALFGDLHLKNEREQFYDWLKWRESIVPNDPIFDGVQKLKNSVDTVLKEAQAASPESRLSPRDLVTQLKDSALDVLDYEMEVDREKFAQLEVTSTRNENSGLEVNGPKVRLLLPESWLANPECYAEVASDLSMALLVTKRAAEHGDDQNRKNETSVLIDQLRSRFLDGRDQDTKIASSTDIITERNKSITPSQVPDLTQLQIDRSGVSSGARRCTHEFVLEKLIDSAKNEAERMKREEKTASNEYSELLADIQNFENLRKELDNPTQRSRAQQKAIALLDEMTKQNLQTDPMHNPHGKPAINYKGKAVVLLTLGTLLLNEFSTDE